MTSPTRSSVSTDDDTPVPSHPSHGIGDLWQVGSTVGLSPGNCDVVDDDCSSGDGSADEASRAGSLFGYRRFLVSARQNGSRTVLVDLDTHQVVDLLPDRQAETATTWLQAHSEITHISRDRGSEYASAASRGAPQAIQVADRFHVAKNLSEAAQELLARVLTELKATSQGTEAAPAREQAEDPLPVEEWRPAPRARVKQAISIRCAERESRYQQVESFHQ
jgi:transposase